MLVHLKDDELFRITIPSKTQAYMLIWRPILTAVGGDAAALVKQADAGICCTPEDSNAIADAARQLAEMSIEKLDQLSKMDETFTLNSSRLKLDRSDSLKC